MATLPFHKIVGWLPERVTAHPPWRGDLRPCTGLIGCGSVSILRPMIIEIEPLSGQRGATGQYNALAAEVVPAKLRRLSPICGLLVRLGINEWEHRYDATRA